MLVWLVICTPSGTCDTPSLDLGPRQTSLDSTVTHIGVIFDCDFRFDKQVNAVVKSSFYHLRLLSRIDYLITAILASLHCLLVYFRIDLVFDF